MVEIAKYMRAWTDVLLFRQLPSGISKNRSVRQSAVVLESYRATFSQKEPSILERGVTDGVILCLSLLINRVLRKLDTFATQRYPLSNVGDESERLYTLQQKDTLNKKLNI